MTQALIPLYCLTGFVGSGKTTVLLSILKQYPQKRSVSSLPNLQLTLKKVTIFPSNVWKAVLLNAPARKKLYLRH